MKNRAWLSSFVFLFFLFIAHLNAPAQVSTVSFKEREISVIFQILASSLDATQKSFGGVCFMDYDESEQQSRVHRILADPVNKAYFGYDLIIGPAITGGEKSTAAAAAAAPIKFKVSIKPLSIKPPASMRLNDLTVVSLPTYPEDMIVANGDSIALDVLVNPQTKINIVDYIKITTRKPSSSSASPINSTNSKPDSSLFGAPKPRDFTMNDVKLRLASPQLFVEGTIGPLCGSKWDGAAEGSLILVDIPGKGRFIFSLFPRDGFNFQKNATIQNDRIIFRSGEVNYEIISSQSIVKGGGSDSSNGGHDIWNLWSLAYSASQPDSVLNRRPASPSPAANGCVQFGAVNEIKSLLRQK